jgi:[acyl-carrier-protein] S-malonyltransferase
MRRSRPSTSSLEDVLVLLSPGQGAQSPGLLTPWLDLPGAADLVDGWSSQVGLDLARLGTTGTADDIRDTAVAQPLLTATALLSARAVLDGATPDAVCGHSVGELPALAVAGVVAPETAMHLAAERGRAMARAAAARPTGMSAVLGGELAAVTATAQRVGLAVATVNAAGQVVVGGPVEGLAALSAAPPPGARVRPLDVAGAFHTPAMLPAVARLQTVVSALTADDASCAVVANADGATLTSGTALLSRLVGQLTGPVRFDLCLQALSELGVTALVELAPGGTLTGIAKRALPGVPVVAVRSKEDLPAARALVTSRVPQTAAAT